MNLLVTGGCGFIGSHIVDYLLFKNFRVKVIDNLSTGFKKNINHNIITIILKYIMKIYVI